MKQKKLIALGLSLCFGVVVFYSCKKEVIVDKATGSNITLKKGGNSSLHKQDAELIKLINSDVSDIDLGRTLIDNIPFSENISKALIKRKNLNEDVLEACLLSNNPASNELIKFMINSKVPKFVVEKVMMISGVDKNLEKTIKNEYPDLNIGQINAIGKGRYANIALDIRAVIFAKDIEESINEDGTITMTYIDAVEVPFNKILHDDDFIELRPNCTSRSVQDGWLCGTLVTKAESGGANGMTTITITCSPSNIKCVRLGALFQHPIGL